MIAKIHVTHMDQHYTQSVRGVETSVFVRRKRQVLWSDY